MIVLDAKGKDVIRLSAAELQPEDTVVIVFNTCRHCDSTDFRAIAKLQGCWPSTCPDCGKRSRYRIYVNFGPNRITVPVWGR